MNPFYRETPSMQPIFLTSMRRPLLGLAALCAIAAAAYYIIAHEKPLVLLPAVMASVTSADSFQRGAADAGRPVHVVISVDCSFCRQIEPVLERLNNATVHYHLLPEHSASVGQDARNVWCAPDPAKAWAIAARGGTVAASQCDDTTLDRNHALALKLGIDRTPTMVFADGRVLASAFSSEALERELASSGARTTK